jgi:uncharacterized membrane protein YoaK (UPF0700 family)
METRAAPQAENLRDLMLICLAFGAGAVDAISFLGLGRVFTANMTGNIVLLGLAAGSAAGSEATRSAISLVAFTAAVSVAVWLSRRASQDHVPPAVLLVDERQLAPVLPLAITTLMGVIAAELVFSARS